MKEDESLRCKTSRPLSFFLSLLYLPLQTINDYAIIKAQEVLTMQKNANENLSKLIKAVIRLDEALDEYNKYGISSSRDGVIQRFEFCTDLSWKATRDYLLLQGYADIDSPKSVLRQAYEDNLIDDDKSWVELLHSRDITAHIYSDSTADDILKRISDTYLNLFKLLINKLRF